MTKAEHIRSLYDGHRTTREIADLVGTSMSYVRTVARQRVNGASVADGNYYERDKIRRRQVYRTGRALGVPTFLARSRCHHPPKQ